MARVVEVILNGAVISGIVEMGSISVQNSGSRREASLRFIDRRGTWIPPRGASILIRVLNTTATDFLGNDVLGNSGTGNGTWQNEVLFGGTIKSWSIELMKAAKIEETLGFLGGEITGNEQIGNPIAGFFYPRWIDAECVDYSVELDARTIDTTYSSKTQKYIFADIVTSKFAARGFTTTYVETGPTIAEFDVTRGENEAVTGRQAFDRLFTITGNPWWVDESRNIWCKAPGGDNVAPIQIDESNSLFVTISPEFDDSQYRNKQYVVLEDGSVVSRDLDDIGGDQTAEVALYGVVENWVKPGGITTTAAAEEYADGLLRRFGHARVSVTITTRQHRCRPGQLLYVFKPSLGISRAMIIDSVDADIGPDGKQRDGSLWPNVKYTIKASEFGDGRADYIEYFRGLIGKN